MKTKYTVCITGALEHTRDWYKEEIEKRGWAFTNKLSRQVDLLVVGATKTPSTGKTKSAEKYGTDVVSGEEFYRILAKN